MRNQAKIHIKNGDEPYLNSVDAMSYWPEKETAVAIRKRGNQDYECISFYGFDSLFDLKLSYNPKRKKAIFAHRISSKKWLEHWPMLTITY